jgi:hypothetical protein
MREGSEATDWTPAEGGCDCGQVRYRLELRPLIVHCCHCRWCQRETGAAFALNALIETDGVSRLAGQVEMVEIPTESGLGQSVARCPGCWLALWSHYGGAGSLLSFVKVGTLDEPDRLPPDVHIFTESRQPWMLLPEGVPAVPTYYRREEVWPAESLTRYDALRPAIKAFRRGRDGGRNRPAERPPSD